MLPEDTEITEPDIESGTISLDDVRKLLAEDREANRAQFAKNLEALKAPDRSTVEALGIGNTPQPVGNTIRTTSQLARGEAVSFSRNQPTDEYYRSLSPAMQEWRTPDSDHWGGEWIRAQYLKDYGRMREAYDKSEEWGARAFGRASTLEGAGSATGAVGGGVGGEFIPRPVEQAILIARNNVAKMRRFASFLPMTRQVHQIPTITSMTAVMTEEASTGPAQGEGTIAQIALIAQKCQVKAIASLEMLDDSAVNLVGIYSQLAGEALGTTEDNQFWSTGNGTPPNVSSKVDGTAYLEQTTLTLSFWDVVEMYRLVNQVYRDNAAWYVASDVLGMLTRVVDANSGRMFYNGLGDSVGFIGDDNGAVGLLLRKPVYEVPLLAGGIIFGDMQRGYIVGQRQGITATSSTEVGFATDTVMWKWTQRIDGNDRDANALQKAAGITSANAVAIPQ